MPKLASDRLCTGCMACKDACLKNAIYTKEKNRIRYIGVDSTLCVECKACERACPIITPQRKNQPKDMKAYGGWANNPKFRHDGASGGAWSALAEAFLKQHKDGVAIGARLENNKVYHYAINKVEDIPLLANSKYIQSNTDGIYKTVKAFLKEGRWVFFSGCPCQIAALYAYLGNMRTHERLLTAGLICHGIPGEEALELHLKYYNSPRLFSFRNKENGQFYTESECTTIDIDGRPVTIKRKDDVFYKIFSTWLLDRKSCSNCQYSSIERIEDITLGDFWGGADEKEFKEGVSAIIVNNQKGYDFLSKADTIHVYETSVFKVAMSNPNLYMGFKFIQYHPIALWPDFFRRLLPESIRLAILTRKMPWLLLWAPYKIMQKIYISWQFGQLRRKYEELWTNKK